VPQCYVNVLATKPHVVQATHAKQTTVNETGQCPG